MFLCSFSYECMHGWENIGTCTYGCMLADRLTVQTLIMLPGYPLALVSAPVAAPCLFTINNAVGMCLKLYHKRVWLHNTVNNAILFYSISFIVLFTVNPQYLICFASWRREGIYTASRYRATLSFVWSCVFGYLVTVSPIFTVFLLCFWSSPTPEGNIWLFGR